MDSHNSDSPSAASSASGSSQGTKRPIDPILRNALRYTVSPKEYELLHQYLLSRAPAVEKRTPQPKRYEAIVKSDNDYNHATARAALRVFVASYSGLKAWEFIMRKLAERQRGKGSVPAEAVAPSPRGASVRISASFSLILLFHRLLHRFLLRLRSSLLEDGAKPFRQRNPRVSQALTSSLTPAVGAALSGLFLGVCPPSQLRMTTAIYVFSRALEFGYNAAEAKGWLGKLGQKDWFGAWMIMPVACGQLLHAFVFDRDCFPESFGGFILKRSPEYIQQRPADLPKTQAWPGTFDIVDGLAELSNLHWPPFTSPILFPKARAVLPTNLNARISPITGPAHPGIKHTSCALLHPHDPSCARTYLKYWLSAFPSTARFFTLIYGGLSLLGYKHLLADPTKFLNILAKRILRITLFVTGSIGTSWASICLFANYLPRTSLPTQRWFLGGFLGGLWAYVARGHDEKTTFMYAFRLSLDSAWKVGVKRGWWSGVRGGAGDVLLFAASLALLDAVYEANPAAVEGAPLRKGLGLLRGEGWVDRTVVTQPAVASAAVIDEKAEQAASAGAQLEDKVREEVEELREKAE